mmetsp:Transcript_5576/g.8194  ORF Transcript_5576/g.8194 Transcript_5576/m.8194 type:complete len:97 (+) Transcript_5576:248-538(+)
MRNMKIIKDKDDTNCDNLLEKNDKDVVNASFVNSIKDATENHTTERNEEKDFHGLTEETTNAPLLYSRSNDAVTPDLTVDAVNAIRCSAPLKNICP